MYTTSQIQQIVFRVLSEQLGLSLRDIRPHHSITADLGADSLDAIEIVMALEDEIGREIDDDAAAKIVSVQDVVDLLSGMFGASAPVSSVPHVQPSAQKESRLTSTDVAEINRVLNSHFKSEDFDYVMEHSALALLITSFRIKIEPKVVKGAVTEWRATADSDSGLRQVSKYKASSPHLLIAVLQASVLFAKDQASA